MAAHLQELSIVETLLADEDGRHRRLHVVVDAALAGALEQSECPVVGVEHHLLRLARISSHKQHAAMAEPDVRHLHGHRRAVQQDDLVAPVELVGFTRREAQRHIGRSRRGAALLAPPSGVAPHGVVAAGITAATQFLEQADQRQALPRRLTFICRQQLIELVAPRSDPRKRLRFPLVTELSRLRSDDLPHDLPGNTEITAYRLDRLTVDKIRATDLSNRLHDQHSNLGSHENGSQCGPSVPGVPIGCRSPRKRGPYSMPKHIGARHASTANFSSLGLRSLNQASPSTWSNGEDRHAKGGGPSCVITRRILPLWTCSLSRLSVSNCFMPSLSSG